MWDTNDSAACTASGSFQWQGQEAYHCATSSEYSVGWNYGANFGGPTKSTWTSGADSCTTGMACNKNGVGMFGTKYVADPSYEEDDGGVCVCV